MGDEQTTEERKGKTPAGGVRSTIAYLDRRGSPTVKSKATGAEIIEYDENNKQVNRTYGFINRSQ